MGSARDSLFRATDLTLKMTFDQKTFSMKVVRLVETVMIAFGLVSIRDRLPPQKNPQDAASLNRTVLKSSDKTNPNLTKGFGRELM